MHGTSQEFWLVYMCEVLHKLPDEIREMDAEDFSLIQLWLETKAEAESKASGKDGNNWKSIVKGGKKVG